MHLRPRMGSAWYKAVLASPRPQRIGLAPPIPTGEPDLGTGISAEALFWCLDGPATSLGLVKWENLNENNDDRQQRCRNL